MGIKAHETEGVRQAIREALLDYIPAIARDTKTVVVAVEVSVNTVIDKIIALGWGPRHERPYPEGTHFRVHLDNGYPEGEWMEVILHWVTLFGDFRVPVFYAAPTDEEKDRGIGWGPQQNPDRFLSLGLPGRHTKSASSA